MHFKESKKLEEDNNRIATKIKSIFLISLCFLYTSIFAQFKDIDKSIIYNARSKALYTFEGLTLLNGQGSLETNSLHLFISKAKLNRKTCELMVEGRLCQSVDTNYNCNSGSPNAVIFSGIKKGDMLIDTTYITETSADRKNYENAGFFSFTIKLREKNFLYFYDYLYYIAEFSIEKIMRSLQLIK